MRRMMTAALVSMTIGLSSCASHAPRYVSVPLPCPARPVLPHVTAADVAPLTDDVYRRIRQREHLLKNYAERLEAICRATHTGGD